MDRPKRPRGRPRREHAVHQVRITLKEDDYERLRGLATGAGTPPSTWVRRIVERELGTARDESVPMILDVPTKLYELLASEAQRRGRTPAEAILSRVQAALGATEIWERAEHVVPVVVWMTEALHEHISDKSGTERVGEFIARMVGKKFDKDR